MNNNYIKKWMFIGFLCCVSNMLQAQFTLNAPANGFNYQWFQNKSNAALPIPGATNASFTTSTPGVYFATYDRVSCPGASDYFVLVDSCDGDELVTLNVTSKTGISWSNGDSGNSITVQATSTPVTYKATSTATSCKANFPAFTIVNSKSCFCTAQIGELMVDMQEICFNEPSVRVFATVSQAPAVPNGYEIIYLLTKGIDLTIEQIVQNTPSFIVNEPGEYGIHTLIAEIDNPNSSNYLDISLLQLNSSTALDVNDLLMASPEICSSFDLVGELISVLPATSDNCVKDANANNDDLKVYNLVSPNGDGTNDNFKIVNADKYPNNTLRIFNRWGSVVYYKEGYFNEFNGISNAKIVIGKSDELPEGTYYYVFDKGDGTSVIADWLYITR